MKKSANYTITPTDVLAIDEAARESTRASIVVLNQPILNEDIVGTLWRRCQYKVCADGGANWLHHLVNRRFQTQGRDFTPDVITGDLDSIKENVLLYYQNEGVKIHVDEDQYSTDFAKSVREVIKLQEKANEPPENIIVLGGLGGRVDQGIGLLHEMYRETRERVEISTGVGPRLCLLSESSLSFLLYPGTTRIQGIDPSKKIFDKHVGILPVYGPAILTTKGLEWDVKDWATEMGVIVSTSNHVLGDVVEITTNHYVLFTVELRAHTAAEIEQAA